MNFFGIGALELVFILVVALLVLGPNKMVETARTLGKYLRELQRAASEVPRLLSLNEEPPKAELPPRQSISDEPSGQQSDEEQGSAPGT